ncbi:MAG: AarF/ABC1/UbiB kinase family protein [Myxococcales bacterium]|nr:AarF/ABC1/UbiB kinase family protein [Myxococcales bacterium]
MLAKAFSDEVVPYCLRSGMLSGGAAPWFALSTFLVVMGAALMYSPPIRRALLTLLQLLVMARRYLGRRLSGDAQLAGPVELRELFVRLGPTYIKFGQLIASSNGLFPERYVREFQKCLDRVPPEPWSVVKETLTRALGRPPEQVFASIDEEPLASASIAQVYAVTVLSGGVTQDLVVKVQRRNLPELVAADVSMLAFCADVLALLPGVRAMNPQAVVAQFQQNIREELDFLGEASRMEEFNRIMAELGRPDVIAPKPYRPLCQRDVLTMERLHGVRVDDLDGLARIGISREQTEARLIDGMHAWFSCMLRYGFFHGDVHAGNLMALGDGRLGFLDFGIIGRLDRTRRKQIASYLLGFATQDFHQLAKTMAAMGAVARKVDEAEWQQFATDLKLAFEPFLRGSLGGIDYSEVITKLIKVAEQHGAHMPSEFVLITRQLLYFDRYAKLLAPSLNLFADPRLLMTVGAEVVSLGALDDE